VWLSTKRLWTISVNVSLGVRVKLHVAPSQACYLRLNVTVYHEHYKTQTYFNLNKKMWYTACMFRWSCTKLSYHELFSPFWPEWNTSHVPSYEAPRTPWRHTYHRFRTTRLAYLILIREFPSLLLDWRKTVLTDDIRDLNNMTTSMA
jgi:hypothetical protein